MSITTYNETDIYTDDKLQQKIVGDFNKITIRHLTLKQIQQAKANPKTILIIDNEPVYRLIVVAQITEIKRIADRLILTLDDYTSIRSYQKIKAIETRESIISNIKLIKLTISFAIKIFEQ